MYIFMYIYIHKMLMEALPRSVFYFLFSNMYVCHTQHSDNFVCINISELSEFCLANLGCGLHRICCQC